MVLEYDVIVIGGGHAGCEAAVASAGMGAATCLVTMDMCKIAQMSCNPAVGGIAKGQIVREIDALGGRMGLVTDASAIQFRMLNRSKGPAVWSPRAQCDREAFAREWRRELDSMPGLEIWQDQATEVIVEDGRAAGVRTAWGVEMRAGAVVLAAGTFLNGTLHVGKRRMPGGRMAEPAAHGLTEGLAARGIATGRMKTGTPVRIDGRSVHFEDLERQDGEDGHHGFSFMGGRRPLAQLPCWVCYTNPDVHSTLLSAIADSPLYNGQIQGVGPRYCPSIETKLVTFPGRDRHPLFLEPEGGDTNEMYLNGFSSSMPIEVQLAALRRIPALRDARAYRPGYAIEYDFFDPTLLSHSLESRVVGGLFLAGQVNGTTGDEEAGGQGLVAGVNAALRCSGGAPLTMRRDESYIGVLIDDLVTKGVDEPYRMFTSRAEHRILLRQDNADERLTERAYRLGLATRERYDWWLEKREAIERIVRYSEGTTVKPRDINPWLAAAGTAPLQEGCRIADLVARPQVCLAGLAEAIPGLREALEAPRNRREEIAEAAETRMKYRGYIARERMVAEKMRRLEDIRIRGRFRYGELKQLSTEARQKLSRIDPETLAQASRIPGVSPSDINVMLVLMNR